MAVTIAVNTIGGIGLKTITESALVEITGVKVNG